MTIIQEPTILQEVKEKQTLLQSLPEDDQYSKYKKLEAHRDFLSLQEASTDPSRATRHMLRSVS